MNKKMLAGIILTTLAAVVYTVEPIFNTLAAEIAALCQILGA